MIAWWHLLTSHVVRLCVTIQIILYVYIYLFWFVEPDPDSRILGGSRIGFLQYFGFYSVERIATRLKRVYSRDLEISFVKSRKRQLCRISAIDIIRSSSHEITMLEILKKVEIKQNGAFPFSAFLHFIFAHVHRMVFQACNKNEISSHS